MAPATETLEIIRGGSFLVEEHPLDQVFIPEEFTEEEQMTGELVADFVDGSVVPVLDQLEAREPGVMEGLLKEAGKLGLFGADFPEAYGGFEQRKAVAMLVSAKLVRGGSFQVGFGCHTGIGSLPIVFFGTPEQRERYIPKMATGELLGAYALTEAGSGTDALAAKSTATLSEDGKHYVLNGEKMFITNAGFAGVFTVFAKVDGEHFTAFILEKEMEGLSTGAEEHKMGIKGSSTRTLVMQDVRVPVENVLGEIGRGHEIAFNILNVGRFKLGASAIGGAELAIVDAVRYGKQREQFGRPIVEFGLIKEKIGEAAARIFAAQSMVYRTAGYIDLNIATLDKKAPDYFKQVIDVGIREYVTECSMMKVFCTEVLDYCVDQAVQILGGYGYVEEYPAERYFRDARINRIWEGTNEINRMVAVGEILKKAAKNDLPIFSQAKALLGELMGLPSLDEEADDSFLADERKLVGKAKKTVLLALGTVAQQLGDKLKDPWANEEVLGFLADMVMDVYGMESSLMRSVKLMDRGETDKAELAGLMTRLFCNDALHRLEIRARDVLSAVCEGDVLTTTLSGLRRTVKHTPVNTVTLRRRIADAVIEKEAWPV
jgi:alkylation response protein AidB-like acyl-CoA dehydrogenase